MIAIILPFSRSIIIFNNVHVFSLVISTYIVRKLSMIKQSTTKGFVVQGNVSNLDHLLIFWNRCAFIFNRENSSLSKIYKFTTPTEQKCLLPYFSMLRRADHESSPSEFNFN